MAQTTPGNSTARPACIGGLYEICVGVPDLAESIAYYERFGCRAGRFGALDAAAARALYGVDSPLRSVRLYHQNADHGLVRLMQWERPVNDGLGLDDNLRCIGSRWGVRLTDSVLERRQSRRHGARPGPADPGHRADPGGHRRGHGRARTPAVRRPDRRRARNGRDPAALPPGVLRALRLREPPLRLHLPAIDVPHQPAHARRHDDRERRPPGAAVLRRGARPAALVRRRATVRAGDRLAADLRARAGTKRTGWWISTIRARATLSTRAARASSRSSASRASSRLADKLDRSRPGCLGLSLYTWRTSDLEGLWKLVQAGGATQVTRRPGR